MQCRQVCKLHVYACQGDLGHRYGRGETFERHMILLDAHVSTGQKIVGSDGYGQETKD